MQFDSLIRTDQQPVRCLIVDDSVFARRNLTNLLQSFGCSVAGEASDGCAALTEYDRVRPDLVLMDITMPHLEGLEAAERLVMVSSVGCQENIVAALQRGARHFVHNPLKAEVLYEVIRYVMADSIAAPVAVGGPTQ